MKCSSLAFYMPLCGLFQLLTASQSWFSKFWLTCALFSLIFPIFVKEFNLVSTNFTWIFCTYLNPTLCNFCLLWCILQFLIKWISSNNLSRIFRSLKIIDYINHLIDKYISYNKTHRIHVKYIFFEFFISTYLATLKYRISYA